MAELLMRQWRLAVLRVALDLAATPPAIVAEVVTFPDGRETVVWTERFAPEAFGIPTRARMLTEPSLIVPHDLVAGVVDALIAHVGHDAGLWLHLQEPRGYLGAVPWEAAITPALDGPMLRIPDRLPVAVPSCETYRVALVASVAEPARIAPHLVGMLARLAQTLRQPLDLELFADVGTREVLGPALQDVAVTGEFVVHEPDRAYEAAQRRWSSEMAASKMRMPSTREPGAAELWTAWVAAGARRRGIGAVHVVADGALDGDRGMLAVAARPTERVDRSTVAYLQADAVRGLADRAGADVLVVDAAPGGSSELASRLVADAVGVTRPGPTVFGAGNLDPDGSALAATHAFLASPTGDQPVPTHPAVFAYLQPERALSAMVAEDSATLLAYKAAPTAGRPSVTAGSVERVDVPNWVAVAKHNIDYEMASLASEPETIGRPSVTKAAYDEGRQHALNELQELIQRHAEPS